MRIHSLISALALAAALAVGACSGNGSRVTPLEGLTLIPLSVETAAKSADVALQNDQITIDRACQVSEYGKLALAAAQSGVLAFIQGDPKSAADYLKAAREALTGVSAEAQARVAHKCGGGN